MKTFDKKNLIFLSIITLVFIIVFSYIFNPKIDLNGDNCDYYMGATSIATGHGYSNISNPAYPAINTFPPGYPILMAPLRMVTDSFVAQTILNGLFLLASVFLFYFFMIRRGLKQSLAFTTAVLMIMSERVLHFATMMMSETSSLFASALAVFSLGMLNSEKLFYKDKWFYVAIISVAFNFHI